MLVDREDGVCRACGSQLEITAVLGKVNAEKLSKGPSLVLGHQGVAEQGQLQAPGIVARIDPVRFTVIAKSGQVKHRVEHVCGIGKQPGALGQRSPNKDNCGLACTHPSYWSSL